MTKEDFEHLKLLFVEYDRIDSWIRDNSEVINRYDMQKLSNSAKDKIEKDIVNYIKDYM